MKSEETIKTAIDLTVMAKGIYEDNKKKGFWDEERNFGELLMLVTSELGEALDAHRKDRNANIEGYLKRESELDYDALGELAIDAKRFMYQDHIKGSVEEEIADTMIRLFDLCGGLNIDIQWHIEKKLEYNRTRPHKHGKKY